MGMDVNSHAGVAIKLSEFLMSIRREHFAAIKLVMASFVSQYEHLQDDVLIRQVCEAVDDNSMRINLLALYESKCDAFELSELFAKISRVVCPIAATRVETFESERANGYEVPIGVPVVVFDDGEGPECFETVLSPVGKALCRSLGKTSIEQSTWTTISF